MGLVPIGVFENMPPTVLAQLAERGLELDWLTGIVDVRPGEPLLFVGSYATGEAVATSDLDFLVLTAETGSRRPGGASNHPSVLGDSFDVQVRDININVEYVPQNTLTNFCSLIDNVALLVHDGVVANLQPLELRLAQRIATGLPLTGADIVKRFRDRLDIVVVRSSAAAINLVVAMDMLEHARLLGGHDRSLVLREASEALILAAINAYGPITYDIKHLYRRAKKIATSADSPTILADVDRMLFIDRMEFTDAVGLMLNHVEDLYRRLRTRPTHLTIVEMLTPFLTRWDWSGRPPGDTAG